MTIVVERADSRERIPLWRNAPISALPVGQTDACTGAIPVLPSGRQALIRVLQQFGLGRADLVAIPEWSSHCLISAVGRVATPVPMQVAISLTSRVAAVIAYEQWGWSRPVEALVELQRTFPNSAIILDRVDSPMLNAPEMEWEGCEIWSLSKTLGFQGGGIARRNGKEWIAEGVLESHAGPVVDFTVASAGNSVLLDFEKFHAVRAPMVVKALCDSGGLMESFRLEAELRRARSRLVKRLAAPVVSERLRLDTCDAAPGIFPALAGSDRDHRERARTLATGQNIETAIYHYASAPSFVQPDYVPCLAIPVHGGIPEARLATLVEMIDSV